MNDSFSRIRSTSVYNFGAFSDMKVGKISVTFPSSILSSTSIKWNNHFKGMFLERPSPKYTSVFFSLIDYCQLKDSNIKDLSLLNIPGKLKLCMDGNNISARGCSSIFTSKWCKNLVFLDLGIDRNIKVIILSRMMVADHYLRHNFSSCSFST